MDRWVIDFGGRLEAAGFNIVLFELVRVEAGIIDAGMVNACATVRDPISYQLSHARSVFDPDADGIPKASDLLTLPH